MSIEWNGKMPKINANAIENFKLETANNKSKPESIFNGKNVKQLPIDITGNIDKTNDNAFDITHEVDHTNDKNFIPINSDLGKQIGRTTQEYRPDIDKYQPVYGKSDSLGRREIIGYVPTNLWDLFK